MARRYAPDHIQLVLRILKDFRGDVSSTSRYTGVPERTIRYWLQQRRRAAARRRPVAGRMADMAGS